MYFQPDLGSFQLFPHFQQALLLACLSLVAIFVVKLYNARVRFIKLKKQGLSMPPHHPIFGHLLLANDLLSKLPSGAHPSYLPGLIRRAIPDVGQVFYLDMWPFNRPILIVSSPSVAYQFTQEHSLRKSPEVHRWIKPLANNQDLVSLEGSRWKQWRSVYNPGFSAGHLISLVPQIAKDVSVFCDILRERARSGVILPLEEATVNLTIDTIGRIVLGTPFNAQRSRNQFVSALRAQITWNLYGTEMNPFIRWNPFRPFFQWYYVWLMDRYISRQLKNRFAAHQEADNPIGAEAGGFQTVVDLALEKYLDEQQVSHTVRSMDAEFEKLAISQMKVFILAGHDTTSSTLCYIFYLLSCNPLALQRVRAEHDEAFGSDLAQTNAKITANPHSLNQLPFTLAVIKETLRLFPVASSTRDGELGFYLTQDGHQYPTEGFTIWCTHQAMHREPSCWLQPDSFVPERWLVSDDDPLHPIKGAWRPFEFGPRNCIGQELALLELKLVMVMILRELNITASYDVGDHDRVKSEPGTVNGERAYQVLKGTTRPADGFPCRVTFAAP